MTNFKPQIFSNFNKIEFFKKNKNQIFCKNFFMFLLLLKYKNNIFFQKSSIFIKPSKRKVYTILRSPYRHKLARHQISLKRYEIKSTIKMQIHKNINIKNFNQLKLIFIEFNKYSNWFESNLIFTHKSKFMFKFSYKNNFIFRNYQ